MAAFAGQRHRASPGAGTRPETPSPVPGPISARGAVGTVVPARTCVSASAGSQGNASASEVKSLIATSVVSPSDSRICSIEKAQL